MAKLEQLKKTYQTEDVWAFPKDYNFLYDHVKKGEKTATSSYFPSYAFFEKEVSIEKEHTILLNDLEEPSQALVMVWSQVKIYPFNKLPEVIPAMEMMDRQTWFDIHRRDFEAAAREMGRTFQETDETLTKCFTVMEVVEIENDIL